MSILDKSYDDYKGSDQRGAMTPTVLDCVISKPEIKKTKDGSSEYISIDLAYKDDSGDWRYIRFNNFNPEKSPNGAQLWKNLLIVAGAKNGTDLEKKEIKVVVFPETYTKKDGSQGKSYEVFEMGYFSKNGKSAGEIEDKKDGKKMLALLQKALEMPVVNNNVPFASTPEDDETMPF
jgi:hypothetical protein